jgi:HK97 family phage major capsid protein
MPDYTDLITRDSVVGGTTGDALVPTPVATQIIQEMPHSSAVLASARRVPMSSKTDRMPVLDVLPVAYFVTGGDTGLKQTSKQAWENLTLIAEEMAVIVPIPEAYLDDAQVPIWDEVRPRVAAAFGKKIDQACLFGVDKPITWGDALVPAAVAHGNEIDEGFSDDLASDVAAVARLIAEDGFSVDSFASAPGLRWRLVGLRSQQGIPIYAPPAGDQPGTLYGYALNESLNGGWDSNQATLVAGDWDNAIIGVRQDITFKMFTEGVITDANGVVVLNLMQQDSVALRAVMRVAWQVANPITELNAVAQTRYPFGVLGPAGS